MLRAVYNVYCIYTYMLLNASMMTKKVTVVYVDIQLLALIL